MNSPSPWFLRYGFHQSIVLAVFCSRWIWLHIPNQAKPKLIQANLFMSQGEKNGYERGKGGSHYGYFAWQMVRGKETDVTQHSLCKFFTSFFMMLPVSSLTEVLVPPYSGGRTSVPRSSCRPASEPWAHSFKVTSASVRSHKRFLPPKTGAWEGAEHLLPQFATELAVLVLRCIAAANFAVETWRLWSLALIENNFLPQPLFCSSSRLETHCI